jgi:DNA-binding transcriptional LysR family regulator
MLPETHRLADLERVPRRELLGEPFLDWPRNIDPELIDHIHRLLFGASDHPRSLSVSELEEARRLQRVANGEGFGIAVVPPGPEYHAPGVAFRRIEEPTPTVGYGLAWSSGHPSPVVGSFVEVAKGFADATATSVLD